MIKRNLVLIRYDADIGCVFDWKEPHYSEDENGNTALDKMVSEHLGIE